MDEFEQKLQRDGYIQALRNPDILKAIRSGLIGRIGITYVEWAGASIHNVIIPWTVIDGAASADAVASLLEKAPISRRTRTSISGALLKSLALFDDSPFTGTRRVIDVSGDGPNNDGPLILLTRALVLERGITINGLPLLIYRGERGLFDLANLEWYYEDCVIGGPGAFSIAVVGTEAFASAIRTKLILEISDLGGRSAAKIDKVADPQPRVSCTIGEQRMRQYFDR